MANNVIAKETKNESKKDDDFYFGKKITYWKSLWNDEYSENVEFVDGLVFCKEHRDWIISRLVY